MYINVAMQRIRYLQDQMLLETLITGQPEDQTKALMNHELEKIRKALWQRHGVGTLVRQ